MKTTNRSLRFASLTVAATLLLSAGRALSSGPMKSTPADVFAAMRSSFQAGKARGVWARYQWDISGPSGGKWWIEVRNGTLRMGKGTIGNPSVTFLVSDRDWVALANDQLGGTWAFLTGRLKIRGDKGLAKKLDAIFP